jgi:RNA polymerase sigma-70 factor, ECF subfamily
MQHEPLDEESLMTEQQSEELLALDVALERLSRIDERQGRIVELRYFVGLSVEETAVLLEISEKTVKRDWSLARAWLHREISGIRDPV